MLIGNRAYVCSAAPDRDRAAEICNRLGRSGLNIEISGMSDDDQETSEARIASARFVLFFFSSQSGSDEQMLESRLETALEVAQQISADRVFIIPVRLDKCDMPPSVDHLQRIDLFMEEGFDQIVATIRTELSLFTDPRDGQVYRTVEMGGRIWLAENLNYEAENSWWYDNAPANGKRFGRLYTWEAAKYACPAGWHIPSLSEWEQLAAAAGGAWDFVKSAKAYEVLTEGSGFHAVLGGLHEFHPFDAFYERDQSGIYFGGDDQSGIYTFVFGGKVRRLLASKAEEKDFVNGYSCRCVMD